MNKYTHMKKNSELKSGQYPVWITQKPMATFGN